jgi:hypothetical protein
MLLWSVGEHHTRGNIITVCAEKARLLKAYQVTTENFSGSVAQFQQLRGTSQLDEYQHLKQSSDEARIKCEEARIALEKHVAEHTC